jgi:hypothetical protein
MKKLVTASGWHGPFNEIVTTEDSYVCNGCYFPFTVVGDNCTIEDYDPAVDIVPPPPDPRTYAEKRVAEYPSFADQFDLLYHGGIDGWKAAIQAVKDKYPKPGA